MMKYNLVLLLLPFALYTGGALADAQECKVDGLSSAPTPCDKNLPNVKDMLTWTQEQRVIGFRNDYRNYPGDVFKHGTPVFPLPKSDKPAPVINYVYNGKPLTLSDYIKGQDVQGLLIIKDGKVIIEKYYDGNNKTSLWTSRSVGKSIVSTLVGNAIKKGEIQSLDDLIVKYEPDFKGTAWDGVTLKQLIQHTSGVAWNENYADPKSDFSALTQCEAEPGTYRCVYDLVRNVKRVPSELPGAVWSYNTGGAWLLGDILEKATGKSIAKNLQDNIWQPFGMASDGVWHSYMKNKHDMGGHGFNATLEDWGRFGMYILNDGMLPDGTRTLPKDWIKDATSWTQAKNSVTTGYPMGQYGYEWWNNNVPADAKNVSPKNDAGDNNSMWAQGIYGQMIAINRKEKVVMVQWATWKEAEPAADKQQLESSVFFNAVVNSLKSK